jgi:VWFA-related protein
VRSLFVAGSLLSVLLAQSQQAPPVFRARVDLVTVDVAVVDKDGKPVTHLAPGDFTITAGARPRRVVSADYVAVATPRTRVPVVLDPVPTPATSSNSQPSDGRSFVFVVDVDHIPQGGGRSAMASLSEYLGRMAPTDRAGFVALPYGTPRVDLTTNHQAVRDAATRVFGARNPLPEILPTVGEAAGIEHLDSNALQDYLDRVGYGCNDNPPGMSGMPIDPPDASEVREIVSRNPGCILRWQPLASRIMEQERQKTRAFFDTLRALAQAMAPIEGPKGIVVISQGMVNDRETLDHLRDFGAASEKGRVTLYGISLDSTASDTSGKYNMISAHARDQQVLLDGIATLTIAGRGDVFMTSGTITNALARIDAETAGYYLLSFAREDADRDGQRSSIEVKVNWPGAVVRARKEFTPEPVKGTPAAALAAAAAPAPVADPKAAIGQMMRWPIGVTELGLDVGTYTTTSAGELRTLVAASAASAGRPISAVGYEISDAHGLMVADAFDAKVTGQSVLGDRQLYLAPVTLAPGRYRMKLAAIDATGRRGSIEHAFEVEDARAGALRLSDVFIGEIAAGSFVPSPWVIPGASTLPVRLDVSAEAADALAGATVSIDLARPGAPSFASMPITLREAGDPKRRTASATLAIGTLPAGEYLVVATLQAADGKSVQRSRVFTKR